MEAIGIKHSWLFKSTPYTANQLEKLIAEFTAKSGISFFSTAEVEEDNGALWFRGAAILRLSSPEDYDRLDAEVCAKFEKHLTEAGLRPTRI